MGSKLNSIKNKSSLSYFAANGFFQLEFNGAGKSILCQEDLYLLELVRYIHLNEKRCRTLNSE